MKSDIFPSKRPDGNSILITVSLRRRVVDDFNHKLTTNNYCVRLFIEHGFEWGGDWIELKDYQHFEKIKEVSYN